jgi:hypothetical protein
MHFKQQQPNKKLIFGPSYCTNLPPDHSLVGRGLKSFKRSVIREGVFFSVDVQGSSAHAVRLPGFKPPTEFELMRTLGHANGVVCMAVRRKDITMDTYFESWHLLFGNPSTGYYRILSEKLNCGNLLVGFIYDSSCDDFKFVQVDGCSRMPYI